MADIADILIDGQDVDMSDLRDYLQELRDDLGGLQDIAGTMALGALGAGTTIPRDLATTFSGHGGGTTTVYAQRHIVTVSGANNVTSARVQYNGTEITGSGTTALAEALHNYVWLKDSANITNARVVEAHLVASGSGSVSGTAAYFSAAGITLTGMTGTIAGVLGFSCGDIGHASRVTNAFAFSASDITASVGAVAGFRGAVASGTNKWNLYLDGTADNFIEGKFRFGATSLVANGSGTVTVGNVGPTNLSIVEWINCVGTGGVARKIPLFA